MSRKLLVLPDDTAAPMLDAINQAKESLRVKMFIFTDPEFQKAIVRAHHRGVKVRVMLNPSRRDGKKENDETRQLLHGEGVQVIDSNPAFELTHEKSMVVDSQAAWIMSLNWDSKNLTETRDYAVVTTHPHEVREIIDCFEADWARHPFDASDQSHLIWCVGNARQRIASFIDATRHLLWVENERYQDPHIIERIVHARCNGIKVHVMARAPHTLKAAKLSEGVGGLRTLQDVGAKVHKIRHPRLHGKLFFADGERAIIGSINLAPGSFNSRRELAIEVRDDHVLKRLHHVIQSDWDNSHSMDLSDSGLLADVGDDRGAELLP